MRQKAELLGGYFDGMVTYVEAGQQEVALVAPPADEVIKLDDALYPEEKIKQVFIYRRQLKHPFKYELVK